MPEPLGRRQLMVGASAAAAAVCVGCSVSASDEMAGILPVPVPTEVSSTAPSEPAALGPAFFLDFGPVDEVVQGIRDADGFWYRPEGRLWLVEYPADALEQARDVYHPTEVAAMESGVIALYQKCPHLGCRVPSCETSQWFECPCHGSKYNRVGEQQGGPAPRGMDRFVTRIEDGNVVVDTGVVIQGPPLGTNTTGQEAAGPFCVGEVAG